MQWQNAARTRIVAGSASLCALFGLGFSAYCTWQMQQHALSTRLALRNASPHAASSAAVILGSSRSTDSGV